MLIGIQPIPGSGRVSAWRTWLYVGQNSPPLRAFVMTADTTHLEIDRPLAHMVEAMAGNGLPAADISVVLAMDLAELPSTCRHELETGSIKANPRVSPGAG